MKTITLQADEQLIRTLERIAQTERKTKSAIIRDAISNYARFLERERLKKQIREASLLVRHDSRKSVDEWSDTLEDGLD